MKSVLLIVITILLGACGAQYQVNSQFNKASVQEGDAWIQAKQQISENCGNYNADNPLPKSKAIETYECRKQIINNVVRPNAISFVELDKYVLNAGQIALKYKKGHIDRDEANLLEQQAFSQYLASLDAQYQQAMNTASQHDQQVAQQRQESMGKYLDRQGDIQNAYQPPIINTPQRTNCYTYGNQLSCTTY